MERNSIYLALAAFLSAVLISIGVFYHGPLLLPTMVLLLSLIGVYMAETGFREGRFQFVHTLSLAVLPLLVFGAALTRSSVALTRLSPSLLLYLFVVAILVKTQLELRGYL